ncbi:hypothetical protein [Gordonia jinhuaensis]|nr:hypothetical protein [Gordonia jinhuaensis]
MREEMTACTAADASVDAAAGAVDRAENPVDRAENFATVPIGGVVSLESPVCLESPRLAVGVR